MASLTTNSESTEYLSAVDPNDRPNISTIVSVLKKLNYVSDWQVIPHTSRYEVVGWLCNTKDVIIGLDDLDLIQQVSRLRCCNVTIQVPKSQGKASIRVMYIPEKEPVCLEDIKVDVRINKRKKWWPL